MPELAAPAPPDPNWADIRPVLDAEIFRLPAKFRTALVLCELDGLDRATVADRLGIPIGTVSSRLSRAKAMLRRRLVRRGITPTLAVLGLYLAQAMAEAATIPPPLAADTAAASVRFAAGTCVGKPAAIAIQVIRSARLKFVAIGVATGVFILGLIGVGFVAGPALLWTEDDAQRIQGEWQVVSARFDGMELANAAELQGVTVTMDAEVFRFGMDFRYAIIPGQSPKAIDMEMLMADGQMVMAHGVYEFEGDRLTIHLAAPPRARPTTVQPVDESGSVMFVLQRLPKN